MDSMDSMDSTFEELGIPFPLFEGLAGEASEYQGVGDCTLCGASERHVFLLGIGCGVMLQCPACGVENGLDADDRVDMPCRSCAATVPFPAFDAEEITVCYECLRAGKAAITTDTELGMISWEEAFEGVTDGVPGLSRDDFEMVAKEDSEVGARIPQEQMFELLRTPNYMTIQGEQWQFCCKRPMVFIGEWSREDFAEHAPDGNGKLLFEQIVQDRMPGLWEDELHDETGVYVFRCPECERLTAHWDIA